MTKEAVGGYHEQLPSRHKMGDFYLDRFATLELSGTHSHEQIRFLHARGDRLFMMGNHRSNADAPVLEHTLEMNGFADLSSNIVYLLGQRLKSSPGTRYFSDAYTHIDVWPPTMKPETQEDKNKAFAMTKNSLLAVREKLEVGKIITVFPEGTRTRDGEMQQFNPQVIKYVDVDDNDMEEANAYVIPFALSGTEDIWPVTSVMPSYRHNTARVNIGEPLLVRDFVSRNNKGDYKDFMGHIQDRVGELYNEISA